MRRFVLAATVVGISCLLGNSAAQAHHGYANYVTEHRVHVEGDVEEIIFKNPHVLMHLKTQDGTKYLVQWQSATWLQQNGVRKNTFRVGDHLIILAAPNRNPALHDFQSVRQVQRPSDGLNMRWPG